MERPTPKEARDRNKTALTHEVTAAAISYLNEHGFKPIETEVPVASGGTLARGWVADLAAFSYPTRTEAIKLKLLRRRPKADYCSSEMETWHEEYEHLPAPLTAIVEVKTCLRDLRKDRKWTLPSPAHICYLAIPQGLVRPEKFPPGWTVLEFKNDQIKLVTKKVTLHEVSPEQVINVVSGIAIRRDHFTRYARLRAAQKEERARQAEERPFTLLSKAISLVLNIRQGGLDENDTLERVLWGYRIKNLPEQTRRRLAAMWGVERVS